MRDFEIPRVVDVTLRRRLVSEANAREHWATRAKRARGHRTMARGTLRLHADPLPPPCRITITRIGKRRLDDDNLSGSAKAIRDGVADWLRIDDGDERLTWRYRQEIGKDYAVRIFVEPWGEAHQAAADVGLGDA